MITLTGKDLTMEQVIKVVRKNEKVQFAAEAEEKIKKSRKMVEKLVKADKVVYGITTGFGRFSDHKISPDKIMQLQENLIKSHAAGTGDFLPQEVVRAMMLLRINALARGYSGIRLKTLNLLLNMLNKDIIPMVPEQGSVGASGDLVPLAHMVLAMLGKSKVCVKGEIIDAKAALTAHGLQPIILQSKEGLALINGTQMMGALGVLAVYDSYNLAFHADLSLSLSLEAMRGILAAFDEDIHRLRPHPGQKKVAENVREIIKGSKLALYEREDRVQDAYSLRCAPQVHGASRDAITHVAGIIEREMNSVTDNPLLFPEKNKVVSGGNFHGQPLAMGLDYLGIAVSELGDIAERRVARLIDSSLSNGLPMFLTEKGGLNSGYMIAQYNAASLVAENRVLANPGSTDSIPTSAGKEDHVSMGSISARKVRQIVKNCEQILAIELITACQGIDLISDKPEEELGKYSRKIYRAIRERVPVLQDDRILYPELNAVREIIHNRELLFPGIKKRLLC